jgi:PhnB protein
MHFYKESLGGELYFQTVGESPMTDQMPKVMKDSILHSTLTNGKIIIMATDMVPKNGIIKGNNLSLMVNCESELEIKNLYEILLISGHSDHPLENTFWGAIFGDLTDKYGNHWLLNYTKEKKQLKNK